MGNAPRGEEAWRGRTGRSGMALPFYMTYPLPMFWEEEDAASRDLDYLIQLYPEQAKKYQEKISRILDGMDYQGSMIYDEYPDRLALFRLAESIQERIRREEEQEAAAAEAGRMPGQVNPDAGRTPGQENADAGRMPGAENLRQNRNVASTGADASSAGLKDRRTLIQILLYYEIFRRRRRNGRSWQGWTPG